MGEVNLNINGQNYAMECDDGQEQRVVDLGGYVDTKMRQIVEAGAASGESHLFVLTTLMLADEIQDLRDHIAANGNGEMPAMPEGEEVIIAQAIETMAERIDSIAQRIQKA